jgi:phosphoribosyl 1,2-cyclic phosphodiesterase
MPRIESAREWMRRAVSVWDDIRKAPDEADLEHPAPYPAALAARILRRLAGIFRAVIRVLKPGAFFVVVAGDVRVGASLVPFHADLIGMMVAGLGARLVDLIIWDRRHEYNNLRPIGYPRQFIACRTHEYVLVFQKPAPSGPGSAGGRESRARFAGSAPDDAPGAVSDAEGEAFA